mmetsp:Transcript_1734/g.6833  ORF Transcript_1734/g.6833 Transcript_1734/m.6833 type:complete len:461 (+) Transcript_1734:723-2105(+)
MRHDAYCYIHWTTSLSWVDHNRQTTQARARALVPGGRGHHTKPIARLGFLGLLLRPPAAVSGRGARRLRVSGWGALGCPCAPCCARVTFWEGFGRCTGSFDGGGFCSGARCEGAASSVPVGALAGTRCEGGAVGCELPRGCARPWRFSGRRLPGGSCARRFRGSAPTCRRVPAVCAAPAAPAPAAPSTRRPPPPPLAAPSLSTSSESEECACGQPSFSSHLEASLSIDWITRLEAGSIPGSCSNSGTGMRGGPTICIARRAERLPPPLEALGAHSAWGMARALSWPATMQSKLADTMASVLPSMAPSPPLKFSWARRPISLARSSTRRSVRARRPTRGRPCRVLLARASLARKTWARSAEAFGAWVAASVAAIASSELTAGAHTKADAARLRSRRRSIDAADVLAVFRLRRMSSYAVRAARRSASRTASPPSARVSPPPAPAEVARGASAAVPSSSMLTG